MSPSRAELVERAGDSGAGVQRFFDLHKRVPMSQREAMKRDLSGLTVPLLERRAWHALSRLLVEQTGQRHSLQGRILAVQLEN